MNRIRFVAIIVALLLTAGSLFFKSLHITVSIAAGAVAIFASFEMLQFIVSRALNQKSPPKTLLFFAAILKFLIVGVLLWILIVKFNVHPLAFLVGLMTMIITLVIEGMITLLKTNYGTNTRGC